MIFLTLGLLGFGVTDLLRFRPESEEAGGRSRLIWHLPAVAAGAGVSGAIAALAGSSLMEVVVVLMVGLAVLGIWVALDSGLRENWPIVPLMWVAAVMIALFSISSLGDPVGGPFQHWYSALDYAFVEEVDADRFLLGCAATIFALASCNRIVVLVLGLVPNSLGEDESRLKGGRFLGPMERIVIGAVILAGDPAAAAIVITAKGLLRFPEINRGSKDERQCSQGEKRMSPDENTEYFLIGTIASLLLATLLTAVISAS